MNIQNRIKLMLGLEYGMQVDSEENKGTKVTILLPLTTSSRET